MNDSKKNYICINGKRFTILPTSEEEYKGLIGAIVNVFSVVAVNSCAKANGDKETVDAIMNFCGHISADAAKRAIQIYAETNPKAKISLDGKALKKEVDA